MGRSRSARGEGERLRTELLDATEQLLAELGDERRVTIRAIVERVGVTPPALYLHFPDKATLIAAVVSRRFAALAEASTIAAAAYESADDPAGALRAGSMAYLAWGRENPGGYRLLFEVPRETELVREDGTTGSVAYDRLVERIRSCQAAGQAADGDAHELAAVAWATMHGLVTLTVLRRRFPWPPLEVMMERLFVGLLGLPPAPEAPAPEAPGS